MILYPILQFYWCVKLYVEHEMIHKNDVGHAVCLIYLSVTFLLIISMRSWKFVPYQLCCGDTQMYKIKSTIEHISIHYSVNVKKVHNH